MDRSMMNHQQKLDGKLDLPCLVMVIVSAWVRLNSLNEYIGIPNVLIVEYRLVDLWKLKWTFCPSSHLCPTVLPYMCTFKSSHFRHAVGWKFVWRILTLQRCHPSLCNESWRSSPIYFKHIFFMVCNMRFAPQSTPFTYRCPIRKRNQTTLSHLKGKWSVQLFSNSPIVLEYETRK
jgi:hypothetical protein